jgi:hypothetical protein
MRKHAELSAPANGRISFRVRRPPRRAPGRSGAPGEIRPQLPVLLSSSYAIDIMQKGCNGFIKKPFSFSELSQKNSWHIGKSAKPSAKMFRSFQTEACFAHKTAR